LGLPALSDKVDLLFTDVVLPGDVDGCVLAREVTSRSPDAKVLLTSGFPGARLTDMQGLGTSVRLLSKPVPDGRPGANGPRGLERREPSRF
jgi:hypothetical protein